MSLKVILSLTIIFSFTSLLPATVAATESSAEPRPLDELAERLKQGTENKAFFRENAHIVIPDLSERMAKDHLWEPIPIDPEQWGKFTQEMEATAVEPLADPAGTPHILLLIDDDIYWEIWEEFKQPVANVAEPPVTPPVDILLIDNSDMQRIEERPMRPEEKARWEDFKQTVANMSFDKISRRIRFSLNEDGQLMCWHSRVHGPMDCEEMINQMFSWIEKAEEQDSLTVSNTEQLIQDFILGQLRQIEAAGKLSVRLEQFMKEQELPNWAISIITSTVTEAQDTSN